MTTAWTAPKAGRMTLADYAKSWLDGRSDLRPVTRAKYEHVLERHVLPTLGAYELAALGLSAIRSWYMGMGGALPDHRRRRLSQAPGHPHHGG